MNVQQFEKVGAAGWQRLYFEPLLHLLFFQARFIDPVDHIHERLAQAIQPEFDLIIRQGIDGGDVHQVIVLAFQQNEVIVQVGGRVQYLLHGFDPEVEAFGYS